MERRFTGTVVRSTGSWYEVREEGAVGGEAAGVAGAGSGAEGAAGKPRADGEVFKARLRGKLRLGGSRATNPVVVGDRVECVMDGGSGAGSSDADRAGGSGDADKAGGSGTGMSGGGGEVWIEKVLPRKNYIIRRASNLSRESHIIAANIDRALVVATLFAPETPTEFIDRFLVTCEAYEIPAAIVLGKMDLVEAAEGGPEAARRFTKIYESAGYRVMHVSAVAGVASARATAVSTADVLGRTGVAGSGRGVDELREYLRGHTTLVSGNSGVGKSTLIKAVDPTLDVRTGEISRAHLKGMHTTTFSQMYPLGGLGDGSNIIDTPGIKGFGLVDIGGGELYHYFPDLMRVAPDCEYYNCTHTHEPGCAVARAVEAGRIAPERYESYLKMLEGDGKYR